MEENPFRSPAAMEPRRDGPLDLLVRLPKRMKYSLERPRGITVLCVWYGVSVPLNILAIGIWIAVAGDFPVIAALPAICSICLAGISAVGMWSGEKWSWWTGASSQLIDTFGSLANFAFVNRAIVTLPVALYLRIAITPPISFVIFLYYFSDVVLDYFDLRRSSKILAATIILTICIVIEALFLAISFALQMPNRAR